MTKENTPLIQELVDALQGMLIVQAGISDDPKAALDAARAVLAKAREVTA